LKVFQLTSRLKEKSIATPFRLLSRRDHKRLVLVICLTLFLAFLDLIGVLLIGVMSSLSITGLSSAQTGNRVNSILTFLGLDGFSLETQVVYIGLLSALALIGKTLLSLIIIRRTLFFLARRSALMSRVLISKYFTIPVSEINQRSAQHSIYTLTDGVTTIMVGVIGALVTLIADVALLIVMGAGLFFVDPVTAISTAVIFGSLAYILYRNMHNDMKRLGEHQTTLGIESNQRIYEAVTSYRELLVRNRRGYYASKIGGIRLELANGQAKMSFLSGLSKYILEIALVVTALLLASYQFSTTTAFRAIATLTVFVAASTRILPAILRLQQGFLGIKVSLAQAKPTVDLIEEFASVTTENFEIKPISRDHKDFKGSVKVSEVCFEYKTNIEVLNNVSLTADPGDFIAIVGGSGAGKTTLVDVIIGALEQKSGSVEISGKSPKSTFSTWPGAVAYVPQDSPVINGTIRENLGLGYPLSDVEDLHCWESLKIARLDEFVATLPNKLDTYVGDRGTRLSGGQRQRLGIARALLTNPKLLILDEATSSLDALTESEISQSLRSFKGKITLLVIAHRLSTVVEADKIYFLEKGVVRGVGNFSELKQKLPEFLAQAELMGL
jgi:ATP-binding cassette, subfamily B, bacterial PglK